MASIYTQVTMSSMTPEDLDDGFMHLTDSQDIAAINDYFGKECKDQDFGSFFVKVTDGDYDTVYGTFLRYAVTNNSVLYLVELIYS